MKTIPLDLIRVLVIQQIDKLYYREGTKFSHRWVWKTKVREMNISYPTYMRYVKLKIDTGPYRKSALNALASFSSLNSGHTSDRRAGAGPPASLPSFIESGQLAHPLSFYRTSPIVRSAAGIRPCGPYLQTDLTTRSPGLSPATVTRGIARSPPSAVSWKPAW